MIPATYSIIMITQIYLHYVFFNMQKLPPYPLPTHNVVVRGHSPVEFEVFFVYSFIILVCHLWI